MAEKRKLINIRLLERTHIQPEDKKYLRETKDDPDHSSTSRGAEIQVPLSLGASLISSGSAEALDAAAGPGVMTAEDSGLVPGKGKK